LQKSLIDSGTSSDSPSLSLTKILQDSQNITDVEIIFVNKTLNDSSIFTDSIDFGSSKSLSDISQVQESHSLSPNKTLNNNANNADDEFKDFHKFINEDAGVTDDLDGEATADDDQTMTFVKVRTDVTALSDVISLLKTKILGDSSATSDSGSIRNQGYCAFDYFAEDYVGDSRTF
jgi:hypothetical protein